MTAAGRRRDDSRPSTSRRSSDPSFSTRSVTARDRSPQGLIAVARRGLQAMIEDLKPGAGAAARLGPFVKGPRTRLFAPASPPSLPVRYPAARSRLPLPRPRKQRCWSASSRGSIACGCSEVSVPAAFHRQPRSTAESRDRGDRRRLPMDVPPTSDFAHQCLRLVLSASGSLPRQVSYLPRGCAPGTVSPL